MADEIELKLETAADARLADQPWLNVSDCHSERQVSVYYDTPDFALRKCGYVLRVRSTGDRHVQTLKSIDGGAGLFSRGEWECAIGQAEPDLGRLENTPIAKLKLGNLERVVHSDVERTSCRLEEAGSELELDVDRGIVVAAGRQMPVSEFEVELISGNPSAAVDLAQRIGAEVPVKLAVMSKAERGFALADGRLSRPTKAEPVRIRRQMRAAEGFATIVSACLRQFRLNEPLVIESRQAEGLHEARVAMRRLRSAFSLFGPVIRDRELPRIKGELRWFSAELGDARNLDVYLDRDLSLDQRRFIEERREKAYDNAIAAMESDRFRRLMLDLVGWTNAGAWRQHPKAARRLEPFVNRRIDRIWSKIVRCSDVSEMDDKQRHRLRIRMKKLRYALEFTEGFHRRKPRRRKKFTKKLRSLQDSLGQLHDGVVARSLGTLNSWIMAPRPSGKTERRLVREADRAGARLRRIGSYWA